MSEVMVSSLCRWPLPIALKVREPSPRLGRKSPAMVPRKLRSCQRYWNSSFWTLAGSAARIAGAPIAPIDGRSRKAARRAVRDLVFMRLPCEEITTRRLREAEPGTFITEAEGRPCPGAGDCRKCLSIAPGEDLAEPGDQLAAAEGLLEQVGLAAE